MRKFLHVAAVLAWLPVPAAAQITLQQNASSNYSWYYPVNPPYAGACLIGAPAGMPLQWGSCVPTLNNQNKTLFAATDAFGRQNVSATITNGANGNFANVVPPNSYPPAGAPALEVIASPMPSLQCPFVVGINQTASTQVASNPGGKHLHVCSFGVVNASGQGVSLVEGTGSTCASNTLGLFGGTSASASFAANGGVFGLSPTVTIPMQNSGDNLCVLQSASNNVSGILTYGVYP